MSYFRNTTGIKSFNTLQVVSLVGLSLLIISLPIQVHVFSQITLPNSLISFKESEEKKLPTQVLNQDFDKNLESIQEALEAQKNKVMELKIPKIVVKPVVAVVTPLPSSSITPPIVIKSGTAGDPTVQELKDLINVNCVKYSCNSEQLIRVMMCESGGTNHRNTFYKGPFQFLSSTFYANAKKLDIINPDILDARQQVLVASYMFGIGQAKQWGCK